MTYAVQALSNDATPVRIDTCHPTEAEADAELARLRAEKRISAGIVFQLDDQEDE